MRNIVLYNKYSGNATGEAKAREAAKAWGKDPLEFVDMTSIDSYEEFFGSLEPDDYVVITGGDGTLNRFVNDTENLDYPVAINYFPVGSGNDFWRDLGLDPANGPVDITEYLKDLPIVEVNGKTCRFLNNVGFGIDGYCSEVGDKLRATSDKPINYAGIAIKGLLFHYKPTTATVTVDGDTHVYKKAWLAPTMNGRYYGGGIMPTPAQDRLNKERTVSCMVLHGSGRLPTLIAFPTMFKGEHVGKKMVATHVGREVTVKFDRPVALQIDGETVLGVTEYKVRSAAL